MHPNKTAVKEAALKMLHKMDNIDLDKIKGFSITVMMDHPEGEDKDDDDYHMMPDGTKMKGKEHPASGKDNLPEKEDDDEEDKDAE